MPIVARSQFDPGTTQVAFDVQRNFSEGMNLFTDPALLGNGQYQLGINVSNRNGGLDPLGLPDEVFSGYKGTKQDVFTAGEYLFVVSGGKLYYKHYTAPDTALTKVEGVNMTADVDRVYHALVPASVINFEGKLTNNDNIEILQRTRTNIEGSPTAIILQDGIKQPAVVYFDGETFIGRSTQNYDQWERGTAQEYVPIGLNMAFVGGILFIVSPDRKLLYRSIVGRPLDFVINIDDQGNKSPSEDEGGARVSAYAVGYDDILAIQPVGGTSLLVSTDSPASHVVEIDYQYLIWAQPTFYVKGRLNAGSIGPRCFVEVLGDMLFIGHDAIYSFNAVANDQNESRYSIFSATVEKLFTLTQTSTSCAIVHNKYALFSLNTAYGKCVLVFDLVTKSFSCIYNNTADVQFKAFATLEPYVDDLYAIGDDDKIYKLFGDTFEPALLTRQFASDEPRVEQKAHTFRTLFDAGYTNDEITLNPIFDGYKYSAFVRSLVAPSLVGKDQYNLDVYTHERISSQKFALSSIGKKSWAIAYLLSWTTDAKLRCIEHEATIATPAIPRGTV